ncbi:gamma-aminobutyric acid type B receptor subunit 2-like [Cyclopterus lumpus]|uniref:gamma-aminobutyric acid type B receptor subunit 2-like n=1 Tax=Cyclopterus lumpus TaxID=8103 RepID=UPI001486647D|nr:gamma-aminobutyric acid type B receptor subunit 2-like [Cyclopterus lumpus]
MKMEEVFRLLPVCWLLVGPVPAQVRHPLPALWMMPGGDNLTADVAPAVRLALQDLKRQPPPLGNYEIQLQLLDSQCDPAESLKALFDALWAGPDYLLLFGGACPSVRALIARSLPALNLLQVSFSASPPSLSNRKWNGNLFSTVPPDRALNQATVKLLQRFRWTRVGVITQEGPRLSEMKKDLSRQLLKADVHVVSSESLSEDVCSSLRRLKEQDVRIVIGQLEEESVSSVLCCAYRLNMFGARYQWVVVDGGTAGWRLEGSGCSASSLLTAAEGSIRLQTRALGNTDTPGISGRTPQDYQDSYLRQVFQDGSKVSPLHTFAYDAVWVAASALSQVMDAVKTREKFSSQRNLSVSREEVQRTLLEAVKQTQFEGVTGPVLFRHGERMTSIELIQFQGSRGVLVGDFSTSTLQLRVVNELLKFPGPGPARDRTLVLVQRQHVSFLLYSTVSSAAAVTIFITLTILFLTVLRHKHERRDGAHDELLLLGLLLSSSSVLVSGVDGASWSLWSSEMLCSVRLWTGSLGLTGSFSVLFLRTWRLHSLCSIKEEPASCALLLLLLLPDLLLLGTWQVLDPLRWVVLQLGPQSISAQDEVVQMFSERCSSSNMQLWLAAACGYKAALLGLGCLVALSVRTPGVFVVAAFSVSGLSASLLTAHNPPVQLCVTGVLVLCCNLFIVGWLFGPKFLRWHGGELQQPATTREDEYRARLSRSNRQMKTRTAQLDLEIENISMQLCETCRHTASGRDAAGGLRSVTWSHVAQVWPEDTTPEREPLSPDSINSPEHMWRRRSVQLPILHLSYLPAGGGVSASSSGLFTMTTSCSTDAPGPITRQL